jgi:predicted secreted protein
VLKDQPVQKVQTDQQVPRVQQELKETQELWVQQVPVELRVVPVQQVLMEPKEIRVILEILVQ